MSLSTYNELITAIANWSDRDETDPQIPDFITLAESSLNNDAGFRVRKMTVEATYISLNGLVPFYEDYLALRSIRNTDGNPLEFVSPSIFAQRQAMGCIGCPRWYTELAGAIHIFPAPDYVSLDIVYYKRLPALSEINTTNWLLQNYPNIYLYGSLLEAGTQTLSAEQILLWQTRYDAAVLKLHTSDKADRWSGSPVAISMPSDVTSCFTNEADYVPPGVSPTPPKFILLIDDQVSTLNIAYEYPVSPHWEGDVTEYILYGAPTWMTIDSTTGLISGVPSAEAIIEGLTASAGNEYGVTLSNEFQMRVLAEPSGPPRFDLSTDQNLFDWHCNVNIPVSFNAFPHFTTGGAVATYSLNNAPSWLGIDAVTGVLRGTPLATEAAVNVSITATNSKGADTSNTFNVQTLNAVTPHKYWRAVYFRNTTQDVYYGQVYCAQLDMMDVHSGNSVCQGGSCFDDQPVLTLEDCTKAFNGDYSNGNNWIGRGEYPDTTKLGYDFSSAVAIVEIGHSVGQFGTQFPKEHAFQYSDDGINYISIFNTVDDVTWVAYERKYHDLIQEA